MKERWSHFNQKEASKLWPNLGISFLTNSKTQPKMASEPFVTNFENQLEMANEPFVTWKFGFSPANEPSSFRYLPPPPPLLF
jgi:hypothetical protein